MIKSYATNRFDLLKHAIDVIRETYGVEVSVEVSGGFNGFLAKTI